MYLVNRIKESGVFRIKNSDMNRGLLGLGLAAECFFRRYSEKKASNIINKSRCARRAANTIELNKAIGYLNKDANSDDMLMQNFIRYGDCMYGGNILGFIPEYARNNPRPRKSVSPVVSSDLKTLCKNFSSNPPTEDKFKLKKSKNNEKVMIYMSNHMKLISFSLLKNSSKNTRLMSDIYRGGYITGLYILCRWIVDNKIPNDEYCFGRIMHNIYDYLSDHE